SVQFANVTSPLAPTTSWAAFFRELSQRSMPGGGVIDNNVVSQQASMPFAEPNGLDLGARPMGEGVDLHYQSIGKRTLAEGDALALTVAKGRASYDRIVDWLVPDTRDDHGRPSEGRGRRGDRDDEELDGAWDALRFKNPFDFPMTTGPAEVVSGGR